MQQTFKTGVIASLIVAMLGPLPGCSTVQAQADGIQTKAQHKVEVEQDKANKPLPVITKTSGSWLMGQAVEVAPTPSPILTQAVTYHPTQRVSLTDVASWVSQTTGLLVDTAEVQAAPSNPQGAMPAVGGAPGVAPSPAPTAPFMGFGAMPSAASTNQAGANQPFAVNYEGSLSGLLDFAGNKAGVWWKFANGRIVFFRTETRTFYLPALARKSMGSSLISANSGATGGSNGGGSGSAGGSSGGISTNSAGGATSTSDYSVDVWGDLEKTAKTVGAGATVTANASLGSVTITGTPAQVRNVEEWVKGLSDNLSQQIALTVHVYKVNITGEDNYSWNPNVVFSSLSQKYGFTLMGPESPAVTSGLNPLNLTASVLKPASGDPAKFSGTQLAYQALSTLGRVSETMQQTVVTLNGQPAPIQAARQTSYLASTTPGAATAIGAAPVPPTLTPGTITTGFTAMFLPRLVNGKILLSMNLTNSTLNSLGTVSSGTASIQTPNIDISTFQQSVRLTPGDSLLLTGLQQDSGKTTNNGVGAATNYFFGGGVDSNVGKQLIAIVITAKVL